MSTNHEEKDSSDKRMELKYCEHCGGLWVRERGAGAVFCEKCQAEVEDMPMRKKKPGRVRLPLGPRKELKYAVVFEGEDPDVDAAGGVA